MKSTLKATILLLSALPVLAAMGAASGEIKGRASTPGSHPLLLII
jgi:hypothetical protein